MKNIHKFTEIIGKSKSGDVHNEVINRDIQTRELINIFNLYLDDAVREWKQILEILNLMEALMNTFCQNFHVCDNQIIIADNEGNLQKAQALYELQQITRMYDLEISLSSS